MLYLQELQNDEVIPLFMTQDDIRRTWADAGRAIAAFPAAPVLTEMRAMVALMLTDVTVDWRTRLMLIAPQVCSLCAASTACGCRLWHGFHVHSYRADGRTRAVHANRKAFSLPSP